MQAGIVLVGFLAVLVISWPAAWLLAGMHLAFAGQWLRLAKLCLLIPLWAVAPALVLAELGPFIAAPDAPELAGEAVRLVRLLVALATVASACWLLISWGRQRPQAQP